MGSSPANGKSHVVCSNVVPVFKKNNKQELEKYRPISLLSVSGKILESLLYDSMLMLMLMFLMFLC